MVYSIYIANLTIFFNVSAYSPYVGKTNQEFYSSGNLGIKENILGVFINNLKLDLTYGLGYGKVYLNSSVTGYYI